MAIFKNLALLGLAVSPSMALPAPYSSGPGAASNGLTSRQFDDKVWEEIAAAVEGTANANSKKRDAQIEDLPEPEAPLQWLVNGPPPFAPVNDRREAVPPPDLDEDVFTILPYPLPASATEKSKRQDAAPQQENVYTILPYPLPDGLAEKMKRQSEDVFTILPYPLPEDVAGNIKREANQRLPPNVVLPVPDYDDLLGINKREANQRLPPYVVLPVPDYDDLLGINKREAKDATNLPYPLPEDVAGNNERQA